jgi:hypothetical protein
MKSSWVLALTSIVIGSYPSLAASSGPITKPASVQVEAFSPEGTAKNVRQVTARFSQPMVTMGDPRLADPFVIVCSASGKGRWADVRNWVYDFDDDLPSGIRCQFTVRKDLKTLDGSKIGGARSFEFDTGGPAIVASFPRDGWEALDEEQVFLLKLDAPAAIESSKDNGKCVVE